MPRRAHAGRLLDDDKMLIDMSDHEFGGQSRRQSLRLRQDFDDIAFLEPPCGIEAKLVVEPRVSRGDELTDLRPG
jgi:hypothetical protein